MKIGALVHFATPYRNAGSETVLHLMLKALAAAGHETVVYITDVGLKKPMIYEGIDLRPVRNVAIGAQRMRAWGPDILISHHQNSTMCAKLARAWGIKSIYLTHNDMDVNMLPLRAQPHLVVHNSEWVKASLERYPIEGEQMVVHPPLDCSRHMVHSPGEGLTLINYNEHKGGKIFAALARRMPDLPFHAVRGGHGVQIHLPRDLPNLEWINHTPDLKPVWAKTRLLLMPSIYESYGLTGIEAGCSGIPTLCNDTPGLRESQGEAGLFVSERENLDEWEAAIRTILVDGYEDASARARANSVRLCQESAEDMRRFVKAVENL